MNPVRPSCSFSGVKSKKQLKSKIKHQQQGQTSRKNICSDSNQNDTVPNEKDKNLPIKEFAGISSDSTRIYLEQTSYDQLTDEACNVLTEDVNYKLRRIIHDCVIKSKLQGRQAITSNDVDETFSDLNIDKVYGAPSSPNWVSFRDKPEIILHYLDDQQINLIEIAEKDFNFSQEGDIVLDRVWLPNENTFEDDMEEFNEIFTEYFQNICQAVISDNEELRYMALRDVSTNSSIGPITDWFYHFSYFLLTDLTYHQFTTRILHFVEILENSPLPSLNIYGKPLKLLICVLLQRILVCNDEDVIKQMSYVLSLFALRTTLKTIIFNKVEELISASLNQEILLPLLNVIYYMGIEGVKRLFIPKIVNFLSLIKWVQDWRVKRITLSIYGLLCKASMNKDMIYDGFKECFDDIRVLVPYYRHEGTTSTFKKEEIDAIRMKKELIKTRRKVNYETITKTKLNEENKSKTIKYCLKDVFDIPPDNVRAVAKERDCQGVSFIIEKRKIANRELPNGNFKRKKETHIIIGKTNLLLSVLKRHTLNRCSNHSLLNWL